MALEIPELDDRRYADLVQEAVAMLPRVAPQWTNHNPSDPGITLIELLAWYSEMLLYRLNRISRDAKLRFLDLLHGVEWKERDRLLQASVEDIDVALREAVLRLREPADYPETKELEAKRVVSAADYEARAVHVTAGDPPERRVARAFCAVRRNLEADVRTWEMDCPGHLSLVLVSEQMPAPDALAALTHKVRDDLDKRRLIGTRLHVVGPCYLWAEFGARIRPRPGAGVQPLRQGISAALERFFGSLPGSGPDGLGWPFGRAIHLSEIYAELDRVPEVDWVEGLHLLRLGYGYKAEDGGRVGVQVGVVAGIGDDTRLGAIPELGAGRLVRDGSGRLISVVLRPHELPNVHIRPEDLSIVD